MALPNLLKNRRFPGFEAFFSAKGLRSWAFHVASESPESRKMKELKAVLTQPGVCYSVDEVSQEDASHAMEEDYRRMQHEIHGANRDLKGYLQELSEVMFRVEEEKTKVYRFKVLVDSGIMQQKDMHELLDKIEELRTTSS